MQDVDNKEVTFSPKVKKALGLSAVGALGFSAIPAFALDTTEVVNTIKGASTAVDAVGLAIIAVVTGMVVIGLIVGMLMRKGR